MARNVPSQKHSSLWTNRNFLFLWTGQTFSLLGDFFFAATITIWMIDQLARGASWLPLATAGVGIALALPSLLLAPIAGVFVDRWDRRRVMLWTDLVRMLLVLGYLGMVLLVHASSWLLASSFGILFLCNCGAQFFDPARTAVVTDIVPEEQRPQAFGSSMQLRYLAQIVGPSLAAPLYIALGPIWAFALNAVSYLISFLLVLSMRVPFYAPNAEQETLGFWRELREGMRFFVTNRVLVTLLITGMIFMFAGMAYNGFEYLYGVQNLHVPTNWLGLYVGCYGIGVVAGMPFTTTIVKRVAQVELLWIFLVGQGIAMIILSRMTTVIPGMICGLFLGLFSTAIFVTVRPLTARVTPRHLIGRVMAFEGTMIMIASLVGTLIASTLASSALKQFHATVAGISFGQLDTIFLVIGLLTICAGIFARLTLYREVKKLDQREVKADPKRRAVLDTTIDQEDLSTI